MNFFPKNDAIVLWNTNSLGKIFEFDVFNKKPNDRQTPEQEKMRKSLGNCNLGWNELSEFDLTLQILRLFIDYEFVTSDFKKKCLLKCGQIQELNHLRFMIRDMYFNDMPIQEFIEQFYPD